MSVPPRALADREAVFRAPGAEHRPLQIVHGMDGWIGSDGTPDAEAIRATLERLKRAGVGGIVTNVSFRDYTRDSRQWDLLRRGLEIARSLDLVVWLYDEVGYPSGAAGGLTLEGHPELEARAIACRTRGFEGPCSIALDPPDILRRVVRVIASGSGGSIDLTAEVETSGALHAVLPAGSWAVRYFFEKAAYEGTHAEKNVHASRRYINVLDRRAVARFVEVTHAAYERELGPGLAGARAFFTDEPSLMSAYVWPLPPNFEGKVRVQDPLVSSDRSPMVAWSPDLPRLFRERKGYDLLDHLPDLFADLSPESRRIREDYREVVALLFADAYFGTIGDWCAARGIESTGHLLVEENALWHVAFLGDLFTLARRIALPGIDMLDSDPVSLLSGESFMVAKQVSSAAHLAGRRLVMSETSDFLQRNAGRAATPAELRGTANLQYLLGVTTIASYYDWREIGDAYRALMDHTARLAVMLTAGRHDAEVGVLYPVRAVAGRYLPQSEPPLPPTQPPEVRAVVAGWTETCRTLLTSQVDFDCLDERALAEGKVAPRALEAGWERYRVIVVPPTDRLSEESLRVLHDLATAGATVVLVRHLDVPPLAGVDPGVFAWVDGVEGIRGAIGKTIPRTMNLTPAAPHLLCARYTLPAGGRLYFLVNNAPATQRFHATLEGEAICRRWDPSGGDVGEPFEARPDAPIPLVLGAFGAILLTAESAR